MARGRPPKPQHLKVLGGTARPARAKNEPKPRPVAPACPKWLPADAKRLWRRLAPRLEALGLLTEVDGEAFAMLCFHWALAQKAARGLYREGLVVKGARGRVKNPLHQVFRDHSTAFARYAGLFALTPSDRARIDLPLPADEEDELERLIRRNREATARP